MHHWSVYHQNLINTNPRVDNLTFGCVADGTGVDRLTDSKPGKACDGNCYKCADVHLDFDDFDVINSPV